MLSLYLCVWVCEKVSALFIFLGVDIGEGVDTSLPKCKKAKLLRKEKKLKKMIENSQDDLLYKSPPVVKTLEDFLDECLTEIPTHRLEVSTFFSYILGGATLLVAS